MDHTSTQEEYQREMARLAEENNRLRAERDQLQWYARLGRILAEQTVLDLTDDAGRPLTGGSNGPDGGSEPVSVEALYRQLGQRAGEPALGEKQPGGSAVEAAGTFRFPVGQQGNDPLYASVRWDEAVRRENSLRVVDLLREAAETNEELHAGEEELRQTLQYVLDTNQKLAESEARYKVLSESSRDLISLHRPDGTFLHVSPSVRNLLGYEPEELVGQDPFGFYHPDSREKIRTELNRRVALGQPGTLLQYRFRCKSGQYTWLETLSQPVFDESGRVTQIHASSRDISDRKKAERERDHFFNHSLDLMVMMDAEGRILRVNRRWQDTLGWRPAQLEGTPLFNYLHPDDLPATRATVMGQLRGGASSIAFENRFRGQNGSYRWLSWFAVMMKDEKVSYGFAQDITLYRQSEEKLRETLRELQTRNHELDHYVYKVSHDLRAPLCSIKGLVSLLREETDPAVVRNYVNLIDKRVDKSDRFIQSVLDHSRMLNTQVQRSAIDFDALIGECFDELRYMECADRLTLRVNVVNQVPFYSDAFRLRIIFKNLISNAIKYMNLRRPDNFIWFSIATDASTLRLKVQDNGIGIDQAYVDRIFSMFFRATERSEGSGLGLYIVKQTVQRLGGTISLQSTLDEGTQFSISLPNSPPAV
ncbi:MAG: PAS domain-containing sensor histidine kinase [Cytophagales bacterium]|nr:PAS domain-containing sensor histidine kinase [Cytophagales bacterium]